jgi:hypothetical protein
MDVKVAARLADQAAKQSDLDRTITTARRGATHGTARSLHFSVRHLRTSHKR